MSTECAECEHDSRGPHDPSCSRYRAPCPECNGDIEGCAHCRRPMTAPDAPGDDLYDSGVTPMPTVCKVWLTTPAETCNGAIKQDPLSGMHECHRCGASYGE